MFHRWAGIIGLSALLINLTFASVVSADWPAINYNFQRNSVVPYSVSSQPKIKWTSQNLWHINFQPIVDSDGTIYLDTVNGLTALDKGGNKKWRFISPNGAAPTGRPVLAADGNIYFTVRPGYCASLIYSLDKNGHEIKEINPTIAQTCGGDLAISNDKKTLYIGLGYPFLQIAALNLDGSVKWKTQTETPYLSTIAVGSDDNLYVGTMGGGYVYALSPDGAVKWTARTGSGSTVRAGSPMVGSDGNIYDSEYGGNEIYSYDKVGKRRVLYSNPNDQFFDTLTETNGVVYAVTGNALLAIKVSDGSLEWRWSLSYPGYIYSNEPVVDKNGISYITTHNKSTNQDALYAILPDGQAKWNISMPVGENYLIIPDDNLIYLAQNSGNEGHLIALSFDGPKPFLDLPFDYKAKGLSFTEAALLMTSYFDHQYPLLSSGLYELPNFSNNIIDYLGTLSTQESYSSHDGYDYAKKAAVDIGDPILASADGIATYISSCAACGNMIEIDHGNGYQTRYMHLQKDGLIVNQPGQKVSVKQGQQIGKVGATGNVSPAGNAGAHIHFMVVQDKNHDGNFDDNIPDGVTDPLGWQSKDPDPWPGYSFYYKGAQRTGDTSFYLYQTALDNLDATLPANGGVFQLDKYNINFPSGSTNQNLKITAKPVPGVKLSDKLVSIGTTLLMDAVDLAGNAVHQLNSLYTLTFDLTTFDAIRFGSQTVTFYSSEDGINWTKEPTTVDWNKKIATTQVNHLSYFTVVAERVDTITPTTTVNFQGSQGQTNWFRSNVNVTLNAQDNPGGLGVDYTMYKVNDGDWQQYTVPLNFSDEGHYQVQYYSGDKDGNIEDVKTSSFDIDKTPPEARVSIDPTNKSLVVTGIDKNPTWTQFSKEHWWDEKGVYLVTDLAENTMKLVADNEDKGINRLSIDSIQYNTGKLIRQPVNSFKVVYEGKGEKTKVREQNLDIEGMVKFTILFDPVKKQSTIIQILPHGKVSREQKNGQVLLQLTTGQGKLNYSY